MNICKKQAITLGIFFGLFSYSTVIAKPVKPSRTRSTATTGTGTTLTGNTMTYSVTKGTNTVAETTYSNNKVTDKKNTTRTISGGAIPAVSTSTTGAKGGTRDAGMASGVYTADSTTSKGKTVDTTYSEGVGGLTVIKNPATGQTATITYIPGSAPLVSDSGGQDSYTTPTVTGSNGRTAQATIAQGSGLMITTTSQPGLTRERNLTASVDDGTVKVDSTATAEGIYNYYDSGYGADYSGEGSVTRSVDSTDSVSGGEREVTMHNASSSGRRSATFTRPRANTPATYNASAFTSDEGGEGLNSGSDFTQGQGGNISVAENYEVSKYGYTQVIDDQLVADSGSVSNYVETHNS